MPTCIGAGTAVSSSTIYAREFRLVSGLSGQVWLKTSLKRAVVVASGTYDAANGSIAGSKSHNPFMYGYANFTYPHSVWIQHERGNDRAGRLHNRSHTTWLIMS